MGMNHHTTAKSLPQTSFNQRFISVIPLLSPLSDEKGVSGAPPGLSRYCNIKQRQRQESASTWMLSWSQRCLPLHDFLLRSPPLNPAQHTRHLAKHIMEECFSTRQLIKAGLARRSYTRTPSRVINMQVMYRWLGKDGIIWHERILFNSTKTLKRCSGLLMRPGLVQSVWFAVATGAHICMA